MKRIFSLGTAMMFCATMSQAQYIENTDAKVGDNQPLSTFAQYQQVLMNFDWKFQMGEADAAQVASPDFDDSQWRSLDLPHDFQFEMPWNEKASQARGFKDMGAAWYRKTFDADTLWKGKRVVLDFGGIMYYGDVYLNGTLVASSEYGYIGLEAEITQQLQYDRPNVVAVYANTGKENGSRWYTGGGLFRDVYLHVQNPTHIARHGVFIHTPKVEATEAEVQIEVEVTGWQKQEASLHATLYAPDGSVVADWDGQMPDHTIARTVEVKMPVAKVPNPQLWDLDHPQLYSADVVVKSHGITVDSLRQRFGIRSIEFGPEFGLKLNGQKVFLMGISNHHDLGAVGIAAFEKTIEREMRQLKSFGYNCIRCSHNPYSESFYRLADEIGLIIVDEIIDKWSDKDYWGGRKPFMTIWPDLFAEWVKSNRNHPSVALWSLGNELQTRSDWSGYATNDWGVTTYRIFDQMVKRYDPTRKTTVAMFPARAGAQRNTADFETYRVPPELAQVTEVSSFNYQSNCYVDYLKHAPWMTLFQSEAQTQKLLWCLWNMPYERTVGLAYWGAIEYWGESNGWPKKGWNYSFFRHTLESNPQAYLIKSAFKADEPLVYIGVIDGQAETIDWNDVKVGRENLSTTWKFETPGSKKLYTFTNAEEVELLQNGKSIGIQKNDVTDPDKRNMITWDVEYTTGGTLLAIARNGGKEVARHQIVTPGKTSSYKIENEILGPETAPFSITEWKADGMDLQYLTIRATDSKGNTVVSDSSVVKVSVDGSASLVAIDNGDHLTNDLFTAEHNTKRLYQGTLQVILRSKRGQTGKVTVVAEVNGKKIKKQILIK